MNKSTRREFTKYAVGACLASKLPLRSLISSGSSPTKDTSKMPLSLDLMGPLAFTIGDRFVEVWMPVLDPAQVSGTKKHKAGIATSVTSGLLEKDDYEISGPSSYPGKPTIYGTAGCKIYGGNPKNYDAKKQRYIYLKLPVPRTIVGLSPVSCEVYPSNTNPTGNYCNFAVGLRFLYDMAGAVVLNPASDSIPIPIPFDPAPGETSVEMAIRYFPIDYNDSGNQDAMNSFHEVSKLFGLDLQLKFEHELMMKVNRNITNMLGGPMQDCTPATLRLG
jgi:hypothetical protein